MIRRIVVVCCLAQWLGHAHAEDLVQIYDLALVYDPQVHEAEATRNAALQARPQGIARMLPNLSILSNANLSRFDTEQTFTSSQLGLQEFWEGSTYLKLNQPVFHSDYWIQLSQAENQIAQAEAEYVAEQQNLLLRTAKAYFGILAAQDNLEFTEAEKRAVGRQLDQAKGRFSAGTAAITDVREAQAGFDEANANVVAAERTLQVAKMALHEIIGPPDFILNVLREEFPLQEPTPPDVTEWGSLAQQKNLIIIAAQNRAELARKTISLESAGHLPTLDLIGSVGIAGTDRPQGLVANSQTIGLQLNIPLYQGGMVNSRVIQAQHQFEAAKQNVEKQRRAVDRQIQDAFYGVSFSISQTGALKTAVESSRTAVDAAETGLGVGRRTMVDVLTTQRNLYRAQRDYAQARYDYIMNGLLLKQGAGTLMREDVELVNTWLRTR